MFINDKMYINYIDEKRHMNNKTELDKIIALIFGFLTLLFIIRFVEDLSNNLE